MSPIGPMDIASYLAAGAVLGALYFFLLNRTVRLHGAQASAARIVPLYLIRMALVVAVFWLIAREGALPLLLALLGFLAARVSALRWMGSD